MSVVFLFFFPFFFTASFPTVSVEKCFSKKKKDEMLELMKNALIVATKYLQKYLSLESPPMEDITCLSPTVRNKDWTICAIGRLAERFSHVMKERDVTVIKDQWVF